MSSHVKNISEWLKTQYIKLHNRHQHFHYIPVELGDETSLETWPLLPVSERLWTCACVKLWTKPMENVWGVVILQISTPDFLLPHSLVEPASLSSVFKSLQGTWKKVGNKNIIFKKSVYSATTYGLLGHFLLIIFSHLKSHMFIWKWPVLLLFIPDFLMNSHLFLILPPFPFYLCRCIIKPSPLLLSHLLVPPFTRKRSKTKGKHPVAVQTCVMVWYFIGDLGWAQRSLQCLVASGFICPWLERLPVWSPAGVFLSWRQFPDVGWMGHVPCGDHGFRKLFCCLSETCASPNEKILIVTKQLRTVRV